ncbi:hypothetical protein K505DRAFT_244528 [Melanomma pulvis-pyrius CBS 109.77]|uniref:Uncharacterized protein n=1 Tax=Melanomma pulvis-pyrius CBS 109.77 TaxID=1314802 RepID=A0A6A6XAC1_9PLEO|nr:hypothetical protein K505DRAFT_244528 [Melanomma pulvis-pyrius CBS 109.77]
MAQITPAQMGTDVFNHLVNSPSNPNNCACGRYMYYSSVCNHAYQVVVHKCGNTTAVSGVASFCKTPAPRHIIWATQVNVPCQHC